MLLWKHLGRKSGDPPIKNPLVYAKVNQLILQDIVGIHALLDLTSDERIFSANSERQSEMRCHFSDFSRNSPFSSLWKVPFFPWKEKLFNDFPQEKKTENKTRKNVLNFIPEWYRQHVSAQVPAPAQFASVASHRKQNDEWLDWSKWRMLHDQGF